MAIGWGGFCRILAYSPDCDWRCVYHLTLYLHISIYLLETITHTTSGQPLCNRPQEILWQINIFTLKWAPTLTSTQSLRHRSLHERWVGLLRFVGEIKPEEVLIWNWWLGIIWFLICICNAAAASALAYNHVHHISPGQKSIRASEIARKTVLKIRVTWCIFIFLSQSLPHCANCKGKLG